MPEVWAVIPAGGSGSRFSGSQDKLRANLAGRPVLIRTLQAFLLVDGIRGIMLVSSAANRPAYETLIAEHLAAYSDRTPIHFALGGATRRDSVYNGLLALPESAEIVAIHDAARPLIRPAIIEKAIAAVTPAQPGAIVAIPVHDTIKQATSTHDQVIDKTIDRALLWRAQTPQVFLKATLLQAHQTLPADAPVTDDAQLLELATLGPVALIEGDESNLKITTQADLMLAEAFLHNQQGG